jgi:hypothetical protein
MEGLECKNFGEMSVPIFGRWELAAADNVYITIEVEAIMVHRLTIYTMYNNYQYIHNQLSVPLEKKHIPITSLHVRLLRQIQYTEKSKTKLKL